MFKYQKIIEEFLDAEIKKLREKEKSELEPHQLKLILAVEEIERKKARI